MAFVLKDRVRETSTTTGTTDFALSATSDYRRFGDAGIMANGDTTLYCAVLGSAWETGIGTWVTGHTLQRTTILESSNGDAKVSFGAGVKDLFMDIPASRVLVRNSSGYVGIGRSGRTFIDIDIAGFEPFDSSAVYLADSANVAHGMTDVHPSDVWGAIVKSYTNGGMILRGMESSGVNAALKLDGMIGASPTVAAIQMRGFKKSGTSIAALGASEIVAEIVNFSTVLFRMFGNGIAAFFNTAVLAASTTSNASLRVPVGSAPSSPVAGDVWNDGGDIKARIGGVSKSLSLLQNYLTGLTLSAAGATATFGIAPGAAADSTNASLMVFAAITKTTSAWAVGSGSGSLDTGSIANNTWYHVWLIQRPDTGVVDVLVSLSASAPTMPTNYTLKRRIGSMKTDGSAQWTAFTQNGDTFLWGVPVVDANATGTSSASRTSIALTVPTGIAMTAMFRGIVSAISSNIILTFTSLLESDVVPSATLADLAVSSPAAGAGSFERVTNTSAQIGWRTNQTGGTFSINTYGWKDTRGK